MGQILNTVSHGRDKALESSCLTQSRAVQDRAAALAPHLSRHPLQHSKHLSGLLGWQLPPGHSTFHLPTHPPRKFKDRKKGAELQLSALVVPWPGQTLCLGKVKAPPPLRSSKGDQDLSLWLSHRDRMLSACSIHSSLTTKLPHLWPVPGQLPPGISTWTANTAAGAKPRTGDKENAGKEQGRVGTGGWLTCGLRGVLDQTPPSFPHPPVPFLGEGGHCSPALSQLLQLCSEGSMG